MKVAYFDLDHTLMLNPFWARVFPYIGEQLSRGVPDLTPSRAVEMVIARSASLQVQRRLESHDWDRVVQSVAADLGLDWTEPVAAIVERGLDASHRVDGALECLRAARADGWRTIAASQGFRRFQEPVVRHLGLWPLLDGATFSDDVGFLKRHRGFYGLLPPSAERVAVIGDVLVDDALYPSNFGFTSILYTGVRKTASIRLCDRRPDFVVERLDDVPDMLRTIGADSRFAYVPPADTAGRCETCAAAIDGDGDRCRLCRCLVEEEEGLAESPEEAAPPSPR